MDRFEGADSVLACRREVHARVDTVFAFDKIVNMLDLIVAWSTRWPIKGEVAFAAVGLKHRAIGRDEHGGVGAAWLGA